MTAARKTHAARQPPHQWAGWITKAEAALEKGTMAKTEIRPLTGLRGVAACWVVSYHVHQEAGLSGYAEEIVKHGYLAVDVFFILSGFVMALSYRHLFAAGFTGRSYAMFLIRRLARVWPLYAATTLAYVTMFSAGLGSGRVALSALIGLLPMNLAMVQAWGFGEFIVHPAWSISTEFAAYLLFPVFAWLLLFSRIATAWLASAAALLVLANLPALAQHTGLNGPLDLSSAGTVWPLLRCLLEFPLGLMTYRMAMAHSGWRKIFSPAASWILAITLFILLTIEGTDLLIVVLIPVLLLQLAHADTAVTRFFGSPPIFFLGKISYAIYLLHWSLLPLQQLGHVFASALGPVAAKFATECLLYAVLLCGAMIAYRVIEMPGRRWVNHLASNLYSGQTAAVEQNAAMGQVDTGVQAEGPR